MTETKKDHWLKALLKLLQRIWRRLRDYLLPNVDYTSGDTSC
ncbi:hypothetical protein [uncultured Amphritea sp.]|nr:hypothetical protein [uncultured Amphritea sp.]